MPASQLWQTWEAGSWGGHNNDFSALVYSISCVCAGHQSSLFCGEPLKLLTCVTPALTVTSRPDGTQTVTLETSMPTSPVFRNTKAHI